MGTFPRTYKAIVDMLVNKVLDVQLARAILRKSGFTSEKADTDLSGLIPPGGDPGDVLWFRFSWSGTPPAPVEDWIPFWFKPQYLQDIEAGYPLALTHPFLGDNKSQVLYSFGSRNPNYSESNPTNRTQTYDAANVGLSASELLVWEDVPPGFWYYPFNVPWFVTKRELNARPGQYLPREIKLRGVVAEGSPNAEMKFCYSTSGSGVWTSLVSADLSGGGGFNSGWVAFNETAAADVYLGLFLNAHSSISRLHMGPVEVLMRWSPRGSLIPDEFLPEAP